MKSRLRLYCLAIGTLLGVMVMTACSQDSTPNKQAPVSTKGADKGLDTLHTGSAQFSPASKFRRKPIIYVVDSYNPDTFGWTREINTGIIAGFKKGGIEEGVHYELVHDTLDAYIHSSQTEMAAQGGRIINDIRSQKPDLVLTTDDDALVWVGLKLNDFPVVFNGINGDPRKYLSSPLIDSVDKPGHNLTGVYQTTYYRQSLSLLKKIIPTARTFSVITDKTTTSMALLGAFKKVDPQSLPLQWKETLISDQFAQWKQALTAWQDNVDAVYLLSANAVKDDSGNLMPSGQVIGWMAAHSRIPEVACWAYQVKQGVLASATDDGVQQGELSALLAMKILKGANPGDLPISTPPNGVPALNLGRAKKHNIAVPQEMISMLIEQGVVFNP